MTNCHNTLFTSNLPHCIYSAEWLRTWELQGAKLAGISLYELMQRAGTAAFNCINCVYPYANYWLILVGHGNNGADGYVVAKLAATAGKQVTVLSCGVRNLLSDEAIQAQTAWLAIGGKIQSKDTFWPKKIDIIVDALLGTGLKSAPRNPYASLIIQANKHLAPICALDIPSGLLADTGATPGEVIHAVHTITFIALKPGLFTGQARSVTGQIHYDDLGLNKWLNDETPFMTRLSTELLPWWLPPCNPCIHKGNNGRLLIIGGDHGLSGAIRMTGEAALRSGVGLVRILTRKENISSLLTARPEIMVSPLNHESLQHALQWADVVVIGPGLGKKTWGTNALNIVKTFDKPMLWDADALNLLALNPNQRHNRIMTPHSAEAARLLHIDVSDIESNRILAVKKLANIYGGVVVLKGAGTLISSYGSDGVTSVVDVGNAGMASGGMGDVLSGIIGSFLAQKLSMYNAACAGCVVHGAAADYLAIKKGKRGMLATDLFPILSQFVNPELHRK
ncbi:bifunctional ADP-dependent NAD(P)H-hydrate dehydratase/NAD(P)H-hydrate epimerase [Candidatus Curculioniphilus buchneri]|uniref:bifunctional ADP-dependent NAD(P)H-hydrate dehydratase/NAD(P)H-hydrate epimerase n=1 Tax=Candidatus Curculioniphilus buchneri TaxID=690594 RepID=UPI00376EF526